VAPFWIFTNPLIVYTVSLNSVRLAVIGPVRVPTLSLGVGDGPLLSSPQPAMPTTNADRPAISSIFPFFISPPLGARCGGAICSRCCMGVS
jgi:hypothetical protein